MKVLVVDTNPSLRGMIKSILALGHADVAEAGDGKTALQLYSTYKPDWVLMDLSLKGMDGLDVTRQLKKVHPEAKIVLVTDQDSLTLRRKAREAGAGGVMLKENLFQELARTQFLPSQTRTKP
ncbi:MAG: hypothetical protein A2X67_15015 [Ignavibacteria bacterium GWA2_55_11]|nr:MAG: hypothetical protein A2X67_15015 [Ignavibacteria bacterium GWA2_55_11]OGU45339.1 MAG: hypothetical protein A2X68_02175 [Ignavibacteria bacterium GWC2_56_12]OGU73564.1 MAG: hypothetical protein A3G43_00585 [Ignavibacteria bacterium RIFCSPLOWO2_12_FULL_56_21]OGU74132.1 MAG: hypothetical protein A3H45_07145 [Ignavibacteria bacterium RIFCSPLOWO2_02_FULL_55_14]HAV24067.1 hypothetical protein [Bacteroidota bacterium]